MGVLQPTYSRLLVAATLLVSLACDVVAAVDQREEDIQLAYRGTHYDVLTTDSRSAAGRTVAAIQHLSTSRAGPEPGRPTIPNASCGATFVAPHFAVTSKHCVDDLVAGGGQPQGRFLVRTFDAVNMNVTEALEMGEVDTGTGWGDWESGTVLDYLNVSGLAVTTLVCNVYCRDAACWDIIYSQGISPDGVTRAQLNARGFNDVDLAVIECPGRTETYIAGVAGDPVPPMGGTGPAMETRWFHEVLDLTTTDFASPEWQHYGPWTSNDDVYTEHYHYTWPHFLLALRTNKTAAGGVARLTNVSRVRHPTIDGAYLGVNYVVDNVAKCHGTSGSGAFTNGSSYTYGPVMTGGGPGLASGTFDNQLCTLGIVGVHPWPVRQFNRAARLVNDRNGVYAPAF